MCALIEKTKHLREKKEQKFGDELGFFAVEAYNAIRTNLSFTFSKKDTGIVFGITSPMSGDGKTFTSINTAIAFAKEGKKVLLIDGDMRRSKIARNLNLETGKGLSNAIVGEEPTVNKNVLVDGLDVISAGDVPPNPSELIGSVGMKNLLQKFSNEYDYVIVDLPPVLPVVDAVSVCKYLDGIVLVILHGTSRKKNIIKTVNQLEFAHARILGFVYNSHHSALKSRYDYKYKYYKKEKYADETLEKKDFPKEGKPEDKKE